MYRSTTVESAVAAKDTDFLRGAEDLLLSSLSPLLFDLSAETDGRIDIEGRLGMAEATVGSTATPMPMLAPCSPLLFCCIDRSLELSLLFPPRGGGIGECPRKFP